MENDMRFNTSSKNEMRNFEDFSRFLGLNNNSNQKTVENATQGQRNLKSLAMVYPVKQSFENLYDPEVALLNGTMFEELNKPFYRSSCKSTNNGEGC
jgi:hypothetical protein